MVQTNSKKKIDEAIYHYKYGMNFFILISFNNKTFYLNIYI